MSALYFQDSSRRLEENLQFIIDPQTGQSRMLGPGIDVIFLFDVNLQFLAIDSQTGQSRMLGPGIDVIFLFDVSKSVRSGRPPVYVKAVNFAKAYVQKV